MVPPVRPARSQRVLRHARKSGRLSPQWCKLAQDQGNIAAPLPAPFLVPACRRLGGEIADKLKRGCLECYTMDNPHHPGRCLS